MLILSFFTLLFFSFFFIQKYFSDTLGISENNNKEIINADIVEPRFSINGGSQKIKVTAKEGNFIDDDNILLNNNVRFKSRNFSLISEKVIFNKKNLTAHSKKYSVFKSKNIEIISKGFNIFENGDQINFLGKSKIIIE